MSKNSFTYQIPTGYVTCGGKLGIYPNQSTLIKITRKSPSNKCRDG